MNERFYVKATRVILLLSLAAAILGSLAFVLLKDLIADLPFSDF